MGYLPYMIEPIIRKNIETIPFECDSINVPNATTELNIFIEGLLKGFGTFVLKNFVITDNGWIHKSGKYYSREEAVQKFIREM